MTPKQLEAHRRMLEKLRAEALKAGPARIEPNRKDPATAGALPGCVRTTTSEAFAAISDTRPRSAPSAFPSPAPSASS